MTTPTGPTSGASSPFPTTAPATAASKANPKPGGELGKDAFMQLLVAQMRYQNPMSPVDGQQYMAQLAQFAQVEKLEAISKSQADAALWGKALSGQAMLGQTVTGVGAAGTEVTGTVTSVTLTDAGPRLDLSGGGSLTVEQVKKVSIPKA